jgi:hypothetical protein
MPQMTSETYMRLGDNQLLDSLGGPNSYQQGTPVNLTAIDPLYIANSNSPGGVDRYAFLFWNVNGEICTANPTPPDLLVPSNDFTSTAWYAGGGSGQERVLTLAFSADLNKTLPDIAIQSVSPSGSPPWDGSSSIVDNSNTAVTITARSTVHSDPDKFFGWTKFHAGTATGPTLEVPKGEFCLAIANYGNDPCLSIKQKIAGVIEQLSEPNPPGVQKALQAELKGLEIFLGQCEKQHS